MGQRREYGIVSGPLRQCPHSGFADAASPEGVDDGIDERHERAAKAEREMIVGSGYPFIFYAP